MHIAIITHFEQPSGAIIYFEISLSLLRYTSRRRAEPKYITA